MCSSRAFASEEPVHANVLKAKARIIGECSVIHSEVSRIKMEEASGNQYSNGDDAGSPESMELPIAEPDLHRMYLSCLPDRYMKAKMSLAAYLIDWAIALLCKVRISPQCRMS